MRNLRGRLEKLERRAWPEKCSGIFVVATEADRRKAEARRGEARAKGQRIVTVTVGGIDLAEGI